MVEPLRCRGDRAPRLAVLALAVGLVGQGCATVDPKPFDEFATSIEALRSGADAALATNDTRTRDRFIEETLGELDRGDAADTIVGLQVGPVEGNPYGWAMEGEPLFFTAKRFRAAVYSLNSALLEYAKLLGQLAAPDRVPQERFDRMAKEMNANLGAAVTAMGGQAPGKELALLSVAAAEGGRLIIEQQRQSHLEDALHADGQKIAAVAGHLQAAMRIAVQSLRQDYLHAWTNTGTSLAEARDAASRKRFLDAMLELDENFITRLGALETLSGAYGELPRAHQELLDAVEKKDVSFASIGEIAAAGKRLHALYQEISETSGSQ